MATTSPPLRFVALDIHRKYLVVGAVDAGQQIVLTPRRFSFEAFSAWAPTHLGPSDAVVLEATSNAWLLYDQLEPLVGSVTVAHPLAVKLIAAARVKTDSRETIKLAHLLAANLVPAVWVPPVPVRELRALVSYRKRLVNQRTQVRNRLHAVLHRHNLTLPFLVQLPALGVLSVMSILAAIGDITRFPSAKKLVGYAGLGASVHDSGETQEARTYYQRGPT